MKIVVAGLWHLGTVTARCLAAAGHEVIGVDEDAALIAKLSGGELPVAEPGLQEIVQAELASGRLRFFASFVDPAQTDVIWITYDTSVDEEDRAYTAYGRTVGLRDRKGPVLGCTPMQQS